MDNAKQTILAVIGMPGSGKSEVVAYLKEKGLSVVRFGQITDDGLTKGGLEINPENEKNFREQLRSELGMAAYAIKAKPQIDERLTGKKIVAIDGLYSWEEYVYLKEEYPGLILVHVYAEPQKRYERLAIRAVRPLTLEEARQRDVAEIEKLNKGGPIAIADYLIENNEDSKDDLKQKIEKLLTRLEIKI